MESSKDKFSPNKKDSRGLLTRNEGGGGGQRGRNVNGETRRPDHVVYGMELGQMLNLVNKIIGWGFKERGRINWLIWHHALR